MDFVFTEDIARANLMAAESDATDEVFNIGSGTETSLLELADALLQVMGSELPVEFGPPRAVNSVTRRLADVSQAEQVPRMAGRGRPRGRPAAAGRLVAGRACAARRGASGRLMTIPVMRPWIGAEEAAAAAAAAVASGWVAQGPRVAEFERAFAASIGVGHAVAVSSCTAALHLAMLAAGVGPGDEVVVPSLSFIATANAARYVGARPVFADVDAATLNLTPETVDPVPDRADPGGHPGGPVRRARRPGRDAQALRSARNRDRGGCGLRGRRRSTEAARSGPARTLPPSASILVSCLRPARAA